MIMGLLVSAGASALLALSRRKRSSVAWIFSLTLTASGPRSLISVCCAPVWTISIPRLGLFGRRQHAGIGLEMRILGAKRQDLHVVADHERD
ncbi:hypothetical protein RCI25_29145, partial [Pseudomonas aeruginosa]